MNQTIKIQQKSPRLLSQRIKNVILKQPNVPSLSDLYVCVCVCACVVYYLITRRHWNETFDRIKGLLVLQILYAKHDPSVWLRTGSNPADINRFLSHNYTTYKQKSTFIEKVVWLFLYFLTIYTTLGFKQERK